MKRIIALGIIAIMIFPVFALTGCGNENTDLSNSKYVGKWKASSLSLQNESEDLGDQEWVIILREDGTGEFAGEGDVSIFTWAPTKDGFKTKGDVKMTFKDDGNNIVSTILGVDLTFEKMN